MERAKSAMSHKKSAGEFRELLAEAEGLAVETEEEFLLHFHLESAEAWQQRAQAALAADRSVLRADEVCRNV